MSDSANMPAYAGIPYWRTPVEEAPPRGCKLLLRTSGGTACIGDWQDDSNFVAWSPMLTFEASTQIRVMIAMCQLMDRTAP